MSKENKERKRLWIVLSLAAMFVLGIPIWWKSTEIHRAELPYSEIEKCANSQTYLTKFDVTIELIFPTKIEKIEKYEQQMKNLLETKNEKIQEKITTRINYLTTTKIDDTFNLQYYHRVFDTCTDLENHFGENKSGKYSFLILLKKPGFVSHKFLLCTKRHLVAFVDDLSDSQLNSIINDISTLVTETIVTSPLTEDKARKKIGTNFGFNLNFNLLQDSDGWESPITNWNFEQVAANTFSGFLNKLSAIAEFSLNSQIIHFVKLQREPKYDETYKHFYFLSSSVPHILPHPNEWNSDFISTNQQTLHFTVYIPPRSFSPLYLRNQLDYPDLFSAYTIPQTGGVVIFNRKDSGNATEIKNDMEFTLAMATFVAQLRELFGLDSFESIASYSQIINSKNGLADWEYDRIIRERTFENLYSATTNLKSLSELVQKLTNMMILDHIQTTVQESLDAVASSTAAIAAGDFELAQRKSRVAMEKAHEAFFDPTMVSMLYFPDEHKFAVYTPLFLPITIPMVLKLISEIKNLRKPTKPKSD